MDAPRNAARRATTGRCASRRGRWRHVVVVASAATATAACGGASDDASEGASTHTAVPSSGSPADAPGSSVALPRASTAAPVTGSSDDVECTPERRGGEVTITQPLFARGMDPAVNLGSVTAGGTEITALYDTLLRFNPDTGDYQPHIAESVEGNADSTEWTVTLRDGVTFSNGDPVTAEAVRYSIERMKAGTASSSGLAQQIAEMEVIDDSTLVLRLAEPWGSFPYVLSEEAGMVVNPAIVDSLSPEEFNTTAPLGSGAGPYVLDRFVPDEEVVLSARDDYWGGPVCVATLRFVPIPGNPAKLDAVELGEVDMALFTDSNVIAEAIEMGIAGYGQRAGIGLMVALNHADPEIQDVRVRQAIAMAIDYDTLNQRVYAGSAEAASALMPADSPIYGGPGVAYDPDQAAALVEAAKADGWDGTLRLIAGTEPDDQETLITLEAMLESVGFDIEAEALEGDEINRRIIADKTYQAGLYGPAAFEESVVNDFVQFLSGSPSNRLNVADPQLDGLIQELVAATDRDQSRAAMEAIQTLWNETVPAVNLYMVDWWMAVDPQIEGIVWTRDVVPMFHNAFVVDTEDS